MYSAALEYAIGVLQGKLAELKGSQTTSTSPAAPLKRGRQKGRTLSPEARLKIQEAQKKRWAQRRQNEAQTAAALEPVATEPEVTTTEAVPEVPKRKKAKA